MSLALEDATYRIRRATLIEGVSCHFQPGRVAVVLGPNGAGKSTVLKLLAGELSPTGGRATLDRRPVTAWPAEDLARRRAVMPQASRPVPLRVGEVVSLGRSPHRKHSSAALDTAAIEDALSKAGIAALAERTVSSLSGGERQRVTLARALAQLPAGRDRDRACLLLDEPTAALDPAHQHAVMSVARTVAAEGATVVAVLHDINLALQYADDALLLRDGRSVAAGAANDVLTAETLADTYGCSVRFLSQDQAGAPPVAVTGR